MEASLSNRHPALRDAVIRAIRAIDTASMRHPLLYLHWRQLVNLLLGLRTQSRFKLCVITGFAVGFWGLMFGMFRSGFVFVYDMAAIAPFRQVLIDYIFAFFYLTLLVMMSLSNAIISFAALYRTQETEFLLTKPMDAIAVFVYRVMESLVFSSWGMIALVVPLILAYGLTVWCPWYFYPLAMIFSFLFIILPCEFGALAALVTVAFLPRSRRRWIIAAGIVLLIPLLIWAWSMASKFIETPFTEEWQQDILEQLSFCQQWLMPSQWTSQGMLIAAQGDLTGSGFYLLLLLSNVLFGGLVCVWLGDRLFLKSWAVTHAHRSIARYALHGRMDRLLNGLLFFLPEKLRLLVVKDILVFVRDPRQWSQCLLFFGLMGLYIVNLPRMRYHLQLPFWRNMVAFLNVGATCLTLSTFTSRFVFPQLSLEGRRFWILALLPMERRTILWGKYFFSMAGSLLISLTLITLSDAQLDVPSFIIAVHILIVIVVCSGLAGISVGLGAAFPNLREENPSKIIAGFGGTLNLVVSIVFIILTVALVALPCHLYFAKEILSLRMFRGLLALSLAFCVGAGIAATWIPMRLGIRSFEELET